jgi:hypothetical protein
MSSSAKSMQYLRLGSLCVDSCRSQNHAQRRSRSHWLTRDHHHDTIAQSTWCVLRSTVREPHDEDPTITAICDGYRVACTLVHSSMECRVVRPLVQSCSRFPSSRAHTSESVAGTFRFNREDNSARFSPGITARARLKFNSSLENVHSCSLVVPN